MRYTEAEMRSPRAPVFRRRAIVAVALIALVWCQVVAAAQACVMSQPDASAASSSTPAGSISDCAGGDSEAGGQECAASDATSDWHKLPVFAALPATAFFAAVTHEHAFFGPARFDVPQGRAPPRSQLCCWLI